MRIEVHYNSDKDILLKPSYQSLIQGIIYQNLDKDIADFLHNYAYESTRKYKLFTYSDISSSDNRYLKGLKVINFYKDIWFSISTNSQEVLKSLILNLKKHPKILFGDNQVRLTKIKIYNPVELNTKHKIRMISPITVYSTSEGKTRYYKPEEPDFSEQIRDNLIRKYKSYNNAKLKTYDFTIKAITKPKKIITSYKDFIIEAYKGIYDIEGTKELIRFAYDVGLGSKNSQGFGMFEVL